MDDQLWLHSLCATKTKSVQAICDCLAKSGIAFQQLTPDNEFGPGIILLAEVTAEICSLVHTFSNNGSRRVLVLAESSTAISNDDAWQVLDAGASDILFWDELSSPGEVISARLQRWNDVDQIVESPLVRNNLVGRCRAWKSALRRIVEVAVFTDAPVLLLGETGTGKELAARLIHTLAEERNEHELIILDCTTIVPDLSGSELFGHERGAFTGAIAARDGAFAQADNGTLFLDEVGELPPEQQVQLLRVLQEGTFKRVGSNKWRESDFRLVCATNRDLQAELEHNLFRRDLYYRIASWVIRLPPLRERIADIIPLVHYFMREVRPDSRALELDERVQAYLLNRDYPGNVRDLRSLAVRIATRHVGPGPITLGEIPADERPNSGSDSWPEVWCDAAVEQAIHRAVANGAKLKEVGRTVEDAAIRIVVEGENGNLQRAADTLGVTDRTLQKWKAKQRQIIDAAAKKNKQ